MLLDDSTHYQVCHAQNFLLCMSENSNNSWVIPNNKSYTSLFAARNWFISNAGKIYSSVV